METDILIGLRFELSGGLGKMAGQIVGRAGDLYLVERDGADHLELLELSDLRSARFYGRPKRDLKPVSTTTSLTPSQSEAPSGGTGSGNAAPRLSDKIRRST